LRRREVSVPNEALGKLIARGDGMLGYCDACGRSRWIDLYALAAKLGRSFPIAQLNGKLRCDQCGSKRLSITISPAHSVLAH